MHGLRDPVLPRRLPLGNLIPEWNAYAAHGAWRAASDRLHATNNFPEFTGGSARPPARTPAS